MSNSLIMAIAGALHQNIPSGGTTPSIVGNVNDFSTGTSYQLSIPAGCVAGDYCVIVVAFASSVTITPPSGASDLLADFLYYTNRIGHIYGYVLTSTDITNGYFVLGATASANHFEAVFLHGQNVSPVDVVGTPASASPNNTNPIACPANSITTVASKTLVLAASFASLGSAGTVSWSATAGWTLVGSTSVSGSYKAAVYSATQLTSGATANASINVTSTGALVQGGGVQISFKS